MMGLQMVRNKSPLNPMSHPKEEERKEEEVQAEVAKEEDNRKVIIKGRIISTEDKEIEVAGNQEAEVEEVVMTEALIKGNQE